MALTWKDISDNRRCLYGKAQRSRFAMSISLEDSTDDLSVSKELLPEELTSLWDVGNEQNWLKPRKSQDPDSLVSLDEFLRVEPPNRSSSDDSYKSSGNEMYVPVEKYVEISRTPLHGSSRRLSRPYFCSSPSNRDRSLLENVTPPSGYFNVVNLTLSETPCSGVKKRIWNLDTSGLNTFTTANTSKNALGVINQYVGTPKHTEIDKFRSRYSSALATKESINFSFTVDPSLTPPGTCEGGVPRCLNVSFVVGCAAQNAVAMKCTDLSNTVDFNETNIRTPLDMTQSPVASKSADSVKPSMSTVIVEQRNSSPLLGRTLTSDVSSYNEIESDLINFSANFTECNGKKCRIVSKMAVEDKQGGEQSDSVYDIADDSITFMNPNAFCLDNNELGSPNRNQNSFDDEGLQLLHLCSTPRPDRVDQKVDFSKLSPIVDSNIPPPCPPASILRRGTFVIGNSRILENSQRFASDNPPSTSTTSSSTGNLVSCDDAIVFKHSKKPRSQFTSGIRKPSTVPTSSTPDLSREILSSAKEVDVFSTSQGLSHHSIQNGCHDRSRIPLPVRINKLP